MKIMLGNKFAKIVSLLAAVAAMVGCDKETKKSEAPPKVPKPAKVSPPADAVAPVAPAAAEPAVEAPAAETVAAPMSSGPMPPPQAKQVDPASVALEGKGRKLTAEEVSLLSYGIEMFKESKGRYPRDLTEAVATRFIRALPQLPVGEKFDYDSKTGAIKVSKGK